MARVGRARQQANERTSNAPATSIGSFIGSYPRSTDLAPVLLGTPVEVTARCFGTSDELPNNPKVERLRDQGPSVVWARLPLSSSAR